MEYGTHIKKVSKASKNLRNHRLTYFAVSQPDTDEWAAFESNGFARSELQQRLLAGENPQDYNSAGDSDPTAIALKNQPSTAGIHLKDYAPNTLWNSVWLHKIVLLGFCALFTAIFVALILLYHFSAVRHGLSTEVARNKYSWTYGPTAGGFAAISERPQSSCLLEAVFVIITALWRQVDYQCKTLAPWQELRKGASPGSHSVLLDYISPFIHECLIASARNRHWAVFSSAIALLLLQLIVRGQAISAT